MSVFLKARRRHIRITDLIPWRVGTRCITFMLHKASVWMHAPLYNIVIGAIYKMKWVSQDHHVSCIWCELGSLNNSTCGRYPWRERSHPLSLSIVQFKNHTCRKLLSFVYKACCGSGQTPNQLRATSQRSGSPRPISLTPGNGPWRLWLSREAV